MKKLITVLFLAALLILPAPLLAKEIKFAVLSDVHYAADAKDKGMTMLKTGKRLTPRVLRQISNRRDIDFVVFTGDIFVDPFYPELKEFKTVLKKNLKKPYFVIPGNHDRSMDKHAKGNVPVFTLDEFVEAFRDHPYKSGDEAYWSADVDGYHLIGLDSTRADTWGGSISGKQLRWFTRDLKQNKDKFTIVFVHHPLVEFYPEKDLRPQFFVTNYRRLERILKKNPQVKFVVAGHYHFPAVIMLDGTAHFSMPSIITYPNEYAVFTVDDARNKVTYKGVPVGGAAYREKSRRGLKDQKDWVERFDSIEEFQGVMRGIRSYSFNPKSH